MECAYELNILDCQKFYQLLSRFYFIISTHHSYLFSSDEKLKLINSLNISSQDLENLIEIIIKIVKEAAQNSIQPQAVQDLLISKGLCTENAKVFSELWAENGKTVLGELKKISLAKWQMKGLSWEFHIESSSKNTARQKHPIAVMDFLLFEPDLPLNITSTKSCSSIKSKNITLQMDKNQLLQFHETLNNIQDQIDALK